MTVAIFRPFLVENQFSRPNAPLSPYTCYTYSESLACWASNELLWSNVSGSYDASEFCWQTLHNFLQLLRTCPIPHLITIESMSFKRHNFFLVEDPFNIQAAMLLSAGFVCCRSPLKCSRESRRATNKVLTRFRECLSGKPLYCSRYILFYTSISSFPPVFIFRNHIKLQLVP